MALPQSNVSKRCGRNGKQCRPRSDCSLIWVYSVCPDLSVRKLRTITVILKVELEPLIFICKRNKIVKMCVCCALLCSALKVKERWKRLKITKGRTHAYPYFKRNKALITYKYCWGKKNVCDTLSSNQSSLKNVLNCTQLWSGHYQIMPRFTVFPGNTCEVGM